MVNRIEGEEEAKERQGRRLRGAKRFEAAVKFLEVRTFDRFSRRRSHKDAG